MAASTPGERDELGESLAELFANVSLMVRGELQVTNNQLALLERMNDRVAQEYSNYGDVAAGLRVFVEQLSEKNRGFDEYISQIDAIDQQVTEFEAVVSMLDEHVSLLEKKVNADTCYQDSCRFPISGIGCVRLVNDMWRHWNCSEASGTKNVELDASTCYSASHASYHCICAGPGLTTNCMLCPYPDPILL